MICHLKDDPLNEHARHVLLLTNFCSRSWFVQVKDICLMYGLPHPLQLLDNPPEKDPFKRLVKKTIVKYWHDILTREAQQLHSLCHFNPLVHSLTHPHPLWMAAGSGPYKVNKATILARMISGRYRTEKLCWFWSDNPGGYCPNATDSLIADKTTMLGRSCYGEASSLIGENTSLGGSNMTHMYPLNTSMLQEPVILATVGPKQGDQPGCAGHVAALDHLAGVVDSSCVERSLLGYHGDPPTCVSRDSSLAPTDVTDSEDNPWSPCGAAPPVSQQCSASFFSPWHTIGQ